MLDFNSPVEVKGCPNAIERQLAHAERNAVSAAYNFAEHLPERRKMMQAWADYLDGLKAGADEVPLISNVGETRQVYAAAPKCPLALCCQTC